MRCDQIEGTQYGTCILNVAIDVTRLFFRIVFAGLLLMTIFWFGRLLLINKAHYIVTRFHVSIRVAQIQNGQYVQNGVF